MFQRQGHRGGSLMYLLNLSHIAVALLHAALFMTYLLYLEVVSQWCG